MNLRRSNLRKTLRAWRDLGADWKDCIVPGTSAADPYFRSYVEELEKDPAEKARLDEARERLRREMGDGDEGAFVA